MYNYNHFYVNLHIMSTRVSNIFDKYWRPTEQPVEICTLYTNIEVICYKLSWRHSFQVIASFLFLWIFQKPFHFAYTQKVNRKLLMCIVRWTNLHYLDLISILRRNWLGITEVEICKLYNATNLISNDTILMILVGL